MTDGFYSILEYLTQHRNILVGQLCLNERNDSNKHTVRTSKHRNDFSFRYKLH